MPPSKSELYKKLSNSCGEDGFQGGPIFIPVDVMNNFITKDSIKAELGRTSGFWLNWSSYLADKVVKNNAKRIFAILLYIKEPWSIKKLLNDGFTDRDLPFVKNRNGLCFAHDTKKIFIPPEDWEDQTLDDFLIKQWIVLAPIFSISGKHLILNRLCPLPFSEEDEGNHSGSNVVYKIEVHRSHQKGFEAEAYKLLVALKEFKSKKDFEQERENLKKIRKLKKNEHITQILATFSQGTKHYIMFPWAEGGDLGNFWEKGNSKIRMPRLALWCLRQMLGLAEALHSLHQEIGHKANCRHGDLKPGNILHFFHAKGEGILKIADFGISRIHHNTTFERFGKPTITRATTRSYEAPEAAPALSGNLGRSRKYDIWSLGCIFLEFTIWLVSGLEDVKKFNDSRKSEPTGEGSCAYFYQITNRTAQLHPEVLRKITDLKRITESKGGTALGDLLDLIKSKLFVVKVDDRLDAAQLCGRLRSIVQRAEFDPIYLFNNGALTAVF